VARSPVYEVQQILQLSETFPVVPIVVVLMRQAFVDSRWLPSDVDQRAK